MGKKNNTVINDLGFTYILQNFDENFNYLSLLKRRVRDQYIQLWNISINNTPKLDLYCQYKTTFCYETYLDSVKNDSLRKHVSRFRLSSHSLEIEVGRFNGTPRANRICKLCNQQVIESEFHFLLSCPLYRNIRNKYVRFTSWPTLRKFISLMSCEKKSVIINTAKYIKEANTLRNNTLDNTL